MTEYPYSKGNKERGVSDNGCCWTGRPDDSFLILANVDYDSMLPRGIAGQYNEACPEAHHLILCHCVPFSATERFETIVDDSRHTVGTFPNTDFDGA
ncbi:hypothetical protein PHLCEN_2v1931 [Hermanssonia centrifuga]|uniref:Uncharacterized protein n=1 Tax=Hermanssonia centrifuga TaxID=98765 RepID=A0A2R6RVH4_9APHY|nr:hypothetical protein PHLCEN_2v1931 [Hermanssonia centrifuga]